jgi:hypothetical protein
MDIICKRIIKESERRANGKYFSRAKSKTKALWHIINKEVEKSLQCGKKIKLNSGTKNNMKSTECGRYTEHLFL